MKKIIILMLFLLMTPSAMAGEIVNVSVHGMVCDFCAQGLNKVFSRKDEVQEIDVSLDEMRITVNLKDDMNLSDEVIKELITDNGFTIIDLKRNSCVELTEC